MTKLRELSYREVIIRLQALGFRFYRQGKGSHELWVRDSDDRSSLYHITRASRFGREPYAPSFVRSVFPSKNLCRLCPDLHKPIGNCFSALAPAMLGVPRWSSTAKVVVANESRNDELWLVRKGEWPAVQLTANDWAWDKHPSWSPAGSQIVLLSNRSGSQQLWRMDADGSNQRQLTNFALEVWDPVWVKYIDN